MDLDAINKIVNQNHYRVAAYSALSKWYVKYHDSVSADDSDAIFKMLLEVGMASDCAKGDQR